MRVQLTTILIIMNLILHSVYGQDREVYFCEGGGCAVADWVYFCEGGGCAVADWIYFCEAGNCSVATYIYISSIDSDADITVSNRPSADADWIHICEGSGCAVADWIYICEGGGCAVAEWVHITSDPSLADITIAMDTESLLGQYDAELRDSMLKKYVAACVYPHIFDSDDY
ncbi:MAG: hypothetical protein K9M19_03800 [Candidatus Marinimicrobia bacterium]|nr:hypothetical protein [Candidatus Neomarinimicrobiota bacterium]